jgi:hypothetical protein
MFVAFHENNFSFGDTLNEAYECLLDKLDADSDISQINISDVYFYKHVAVETKLDITEE